MVWVIGNETTRPITEEELEESSVKLGIFVGLVSLATTFITGHYLELYGIHFIPETGVAILIGAFAMMIALMTERDDIIAMMKFDMEFFMNWLIPPIIFEAAFNMNVAAFFASIKPTLIFAFMGTVLSTFIVAGVVFAAGAYGLAYPLSPLASLTFGSLISATDPVAVLATFQSLGVKQDLFAMVFGESVLNDAVAIVLTRTLVAFTTSEVSLAAIGSAVLTFTTIFCGSMGIGIVFGIISALMFKKLRLFDHGESVFMEVSLSVTCPWGSFFLAEALELSGIVAILFCGIVFALYTRVNVSEMAIVLMAGTYKSVATIAETFVFVYLGMALVRMAKVGLFAGTVWRLCFFGIVGCFLGRTHIFAGSWFINLFRKPSDDPPPITGKYQLLMWWSGLRGGVAFAIAALSYEHLDFPQHCGGGDYTWGKSDKALFDCETEVVADDGTAILQMTMMIAVFTTFAFGGSMPSLAEVCDVKADKSGAVDHEDKKVTAMDNKAAPLLSGPSGKFDMSKHVEASHSWLVRWLTHEEDYTYLLEEAEEAQDRSMALHSLETAQFFGSGDEGHMAMPLPSGVHQHHTALHASMAPPLSRATRRSRESKEKKEVGSATDYRKM